MSIYETLADNFLAARKLLPDRKWNDQIHARIDEYFENVAQVLASRNEKLAEEFNRSERAAAEAVKAATAQYELKFGSEFKKANDVEKRKIEIHLALVSHVSRVPIIELDYEMDKLLIMENFDAWIPQPWIIQASNVTLSI